MDVITKELLDVYFTTIRKGFEEGKLAVDLRTELIEGEPKDGYKTFTQGDKILKFTIVK